MIICAICRNVFSPKRTHCPVCGAIAASVKQLSNLVLKEKYILLKGQKYRSRHEYDTSLNIDNKRVIVRANEE